MDRARHNDAEPRYEVVWPLGRSTVDDVVPNAPIADLNGRTIGELWDWLFKGDQMFALIREELQRRYPDIRFISFETLGNIHGQDEKQVLAALPDLMEHYQIDAVVSSIGA